MITRDYLYKLYKAKRCKGCVAFGFDKNHKRYFSVNGEATMCYKDLDPILRFFGDSPVFCGYNFAFTVIKRFPPVSLKKLDETYKKCEDVEKNKQEIIGFDLLPFRMYKKYPGSAYFEDRHFHCAEKKIIGYCDFVDIKIDKIFTTKTPCYYCLPVINTVVYLSRDNKRKNTVKRSADPVSIVNGETNYLFTR